MANIDRALDRVPGINKAVFDGEDETFTIDYDPAQTDVRALKRSVLAAVVAPAARRWLGNVGCRLRRE